MSKRTPVNESRFRAIDDPAAAFPMGALAGMVASQEDDPEGVDELVEEESDEAWAGPGGIHPAFLVLSLLGGAVLAMGIVGLIGLVLFLG